MKKRLSWIFGFFVLCLMICCDADAQTVCYLKYKGKGDQSMNKKDFDDAIKQYQAAKVCDSLTPDLAFQLDTLIENAYAKWVSELKNNRKTLELTNASLEKTLKNFIVSNAFIYASKGNFNAAINELKQHRNFPEVVSFYNQLSPFLSDKHIERVIKYYPWVKKDVQLVALLLKVPKVVARNKKQSENEDDQSPIKQQLRLSVMDLSGETVKEIFSDDIQTGEEIGDITINVMNDELVVFAGPKCYFYSVTGGQPAAITKRGELTYVALSENKDEAVQGENEQSPADEFISNYYQDINVDLLTSNLFFSISNLRVDSKDVPIFSFTLRNVATNQVIFKKNRITDFRYYPTLQKIALLEKDGDLKNLLMYTIPENSFTEPVKNISSVSYYNSSSNPNNRLFISLYRQPTGDSSTQQPIAQTAAAKRELFDIVNGFIVNNNSFLSDFSRYGIGADSRNYRYLFYSLKNGYLFYNATTRQVKRYRFNDSVATTTNNVKQVIYLAPQDKLLLIFGRTNQPSVPSRDTLMVYSEAGKDGAVYLASKIRMIGDSIAIMTTDSSFAIYSLTGKKGGENVFTLKRKIADTEKDVQTGLLGNGILTIKTAALQTAKPDTSTLFYSVNQHKILLETRDLTEHPTYKFQNAVEGLPINESSNLSGAYSYLVYTSSPAQQKIYFIDTLKGEFDSATINLHRDVFGKADYFYYFPGKNLLLVKSTPEKKETSNSNSRGFDPDWEVSRLMLYQLNDGGAKTIKTGFAVDDETAFLIGGKHLMLYALPNADSEEYSCFFYRLSTEKARSMPGLKSQSSAVHKP